MRPGPVAGHATRQAGVAGGRARRVPIIHLPSVSKLPALSSFFTDPIVWILALAALVSGGLLLWPALTGAHGGGVAAAEVVRLFNREKASVIDVSEPGEFAAGHIVGSRNIPLGRLEVAPELPRNKSLPVVLVCASGKRAAKAAKALEVKGYAKAVVLAGGLAAWRTANLPIETAPAA